MTALEGVEATAPRWERLIAALCPFAHERAPKSVAIPTRSVSVAMTGVLVREMDQPTVV